MSIQGIWVNININALSCGLVQIVLFSVLMTCLQPCSQEWKHLMTITVQFSVQAAQSLPQSAAPLLLSVKHRAFLFPPWFKCFFLPLKPPLPCLGEAVSNSRWGPQPDVLQAHGYALPHAPAPFHFPLFPLLSTGFEVGGPSSQRHKPDTKHIMHLHEEVSLKYTFKRSTYI